MPESMTPLVAVGVIGALFILLLSLLTNNYSLNNIKSKTVGDGQYGTARWATDQEIRKAYVTVPFDVASWRAGKKRPTVQGLVLGSVQRGKRLNALVDCDDVHCLMIGASGVGKTAFFLYPNIEFACACGMSFLILDTKGDLARNCGRIAQKYYGYNVSVIDLRNPIRSDGNNLMTLVNRYMDVAREHPDNLKARANAEKYAWVDTLEDERLLRAIMKLNKKDLELLTYVTLEGHGQEELARRWGCTQAAVAIRMKKIKKIFQTTL